MERRLTQVLSYSLENSAFFYLDLALSGESGSKQGRLTISGRTFSCNLLIESSLVSM